MKKFSEYVNQNVVIESISNDLKNLKRFVEWIEEYESNAKYKKFVEDVWKIFYDGFGDSLKVSKNMIKALKSLRAIEPENPIVKKYAKDLD